MIDLLRNCPALVGVTRLDDQHQEMHRLLWGLLKTLETYPSGSQPEYRFIQFSDQTAEHFRTEEEFLETMGYPDLASHRIEHERILERLKEHMARWHTPSALPLIDLAEKFVASTQSHWKTVDRAYVEWLEGQAAISILRSDSDANSPRMSASGTGQGQVQVQIASSYNLLSGSQLRNTRQPGREQGSIEGS